MLGKRLDGSYATEVRDAVTTLTLAKIGANSAARFAAPFLATIASDLDVSLATAGGALAVGELCGLSAPLLTRLASRMSRRATISLGLLGVATAVTICATSQHIVQLAIGLALITMSKIVFDLGVIAWISDRVPYQQLGRAIGLTETAWALGLLIGVASMGVIAGLASWRWGYMLAAVAAVAFSALVRARLGDEAAHPVLPRSRGRAQLGRGWWVITGNLAITAGSQAVFVTFGTWLEDEFGFEETGIAAVIFAIGAVELAASSSSMRLADAWGKGRSVIVGALVMIPCGILLALAEHTLALGLVVLAVFIGAFEFAVVSTVSMAASLDPRHAATGVGFTMGGGTLGRALMAPIATAALSAHGMWLPAVIGVCCAAAGVVCQLAYAARPRPPFAG